MPPSEETNRKQNKGFDKLKRKRTTNVVKSRGITSALVVVSLVAIALIIILVFFRVKEIRIEGNQTYNNQDIIDDCGIKIGDNLYLLNDSEVSNNLLSSYPLVRKVKINRKIPNTIVLQLSCDEVYFYIEIQGEYFLVTNTLRVVGKADSIEYVTEHFPQAKHLICADVEEAIISKKLKFTKDNYITDIGPFISILCESEVYEGLTTIDISDRFHIALVYNHTKKIEMGDTTDNDLKLRFANEIIKDLGAQSAVINVEDVNTGYAIPGAEESYD